LAVAAQVEITDPFIITRDEIGKIVCSIAKDDQFRIQITLLLKAPDCLGQKMLPIAGRRHDTRHQRLCLPDGI
jgi:hypothetical protein